MASRLYDYNKIINFGEQSAMDGYYLLYNHEHDNLIIANTNIAVPGGNKEYKNWKYFSSDFFTFPSLQIIQIGGSSAAFTSTASRNYQRNINQIFESYYASFCETGVHTSIAEYLEQFEFIFESIPQTRMNQIQGDFAEALLWLEAKALGIDMGKYYHSANNSLFDFFNREGNFFIEVKSTIKQDNMYRFNFEQLPPEGGGFYAFYKLIVKMTHSDTSRSLTSLYSEIETNNQLMNKKKNRWMLETSLNSRLDDIEFEVEDKFISNLRDLTIPVFTSPAFTKVNAILNGNLLSKDREYIKTLEEIFA